MGILASRTFRALFGCPEDESSVCWLPLGSFISSGYTLFAKAFKRSWRQSFIVPLGATGLGTRWSVERFRKAGYLCILPTLEDLCVLKTFKMFGMNYVGAAFVTTEVVCFYHKCDKAFQNQDTHLRRTITYENNSVAY